MPGDGPTVSDLGRRNPRLLHDPSLFNPGETALRELLVRERFNGESSFNV